MIGMDIVYQIEKVPKGSNDKPIEDVVIADCGVVAPGDLTDMNDDDDDNDDDD
jgi:hypothetical protein